MLKFLVKQQKIEVLEREIIADKQIAFVNLKFIFEGGWKKFHKVVQFLQCDETYNRVLGYDGVSCYLPAELHAGTVKMSLFGYDTVNPCGLRATTVPVTLHIRPSGFGCDYSQVPPTPDLYAQLLQQIDEKVASLQNGVNGKDGVSVTNAFVNEAGNLIITLSDGRKIDAGLVRDSSGTVSDGTVATDAEVEEMLDGIFNVN